MEENHLEKLYSAEGRKFTISIIRMLNSDKFSELIKEFDERNDLSDIDYETKTHNLDIMIDLVSIGKGQVRIETFGAIVKNDEYWQGLWSNKDYYNNLCAYYGGEVIAKLCLVRDKVEDGNIILEWTIVEINNNTYSHINELAARMSQNGILGPIIIPESKEP